MKISVQPLNDNVFIKEDQLEESATASGIIVNSATGQTISGQGTIVAIGKSTIEKIKKEQGVDIKVGDKIYFSRFSAEEVLMYDESGVKQSGYQKLHMSALAGITNE